MDSRGSGQKRPEDREGLPDGTDSGGQGVLPRRLRKSALQLPALWQRADAKFYTPVSTSVVNEILLVKYLEQSLAFK